MTIGPVAVSIVSMSIVSIVSVVATEILVTRGVFPRPVGVGSGVGAKVGM